MSKIMYKGTEYIGEDINVSGVKGNSETIYRRGNVNLTLANVGIHISTSAPTSSDGNDGDIWLVYTDNEE